MSPGMLSKCLLRCISSWHSSSSRCLVGSTDQACSSGFYFIISAESQKYKHKIGHNYILYFLKSKTVRGFLLIIEIGIIFTVNSISEIKNFGGVM